MKKLINLAILLSLIAGGSLLSCADSESRLPTEGDATVIINLGLPPDAEASDVSVIDRFLRFFARDAVAATAPASFGNVNVQVTGTGIGLINKDFPATGVISMTVPGGGIRTFVVTAQVAAGDPSAALSFSGTAIANVPSGATVSVPVLMELDETKLLIPDYYNQRLVMMDRINASNTTTRNATQLFITARTLNPWDVDIDRRGRIYFSNPSATTSGGIYRMDNINSTWAAGTCIQLVSTLSGVSNIAIDRKRNYLYYIDEVSYGNLIRYNLPDGPSQTLISGTLTLQLANVCVDNDTGYLFISYTVSGTGLTRWVRSYNPAIPGWIGSASLRSVLPFDMTVHGGYLYESYMGSTSINQVSLDSLTTVNTLTGAPSPLTDSFIGPTLFIGLTNRKLFVIDDSMWWDPDDRIVSFDDIDGSGWETTDTPGTFKFYYTC